MDEKIKKFNTRFLQKSLYQLLQCRGEYDLLITALSEQDIDRLIEFNVFFSRAYSPSSIMELRNVPACVSMKLIVFDANFSTLFLPDEVVGIFLHEIGHAFNSELKGMEGEYAADRFASEKGYSKWIAEGLRKGLKKTLLGFNESSINMRIAELQNH